MAARGSLPPNIPPPPTPMLVRNRPRRQRKAQVAQAPAAPAPAPAPSVELPLNVVDLEELIIAREQDYNRVLVAPWIDQAPPPRDPQSEPREPRTERKLGWFSTILTMLGFKR